MRLPARKLLATSMGLYLPMAASAVEGQPAGEENLLAAIKLEVEQM